MAKYMLIVEGEAFAGQAEASKTFIDHQHFPDLLAIEGFISAQRFQIREREGAPFKPVLIYEIEVPDIDELFTEMAKRRAEGKLPAAPTLDSSKTRITVCEPGSEKVLRDHRIQGQGG